MQKRTQFGKIAANHSGKSAYKGLPGNVMIGQDGRPAGHRVVVCVKYVTLFFARGANGSVSSAPRSAGSSTGLLTCRYGGVRKAVLEMVETPACAGVTKLDAGGDTQKCGSVSRRALDRFSKPCFPIAIQRMGNDRACPVARGWGVPNTKPLEKCETGVYNY